MKAKFYFMAFMLMASVCAFAQWTKPAAPEGTTLTAGEQVYLYNVEADAFLLGANDWQTRASVDGVRGYKVWLEPHAEDAASYYITNYIEDGNPAGKTLCVYISTENGTENIWVDQEKTTDTDKLFTFEAQADGTYKIGLSALNAIYNPKDYPDTYFGLIPEKNDTRLYLCAPEVYNLPEFDPAGFMTTWKIIAPAEYTTYTTAKKTWIAAVKLAEEIEKAKAENTGIDISEVEAVYANTASTEAQLEAASAQLVELVIAFQTAKASPETPADYTPYIVNPSYDKNNKEGWSGTEPGFQTFGNAEFYNKESVDFYQTITGLKNGVYKVTVNAFYRAGREAQDAEEYKKLLEEGDASGQKAKFYATTSVINSYVKPLPFASSGASAESITKDEVTNEYGYIPNMMESAAFYMAHGQYQPTTVVTAVEDGKITIGLKKDSKFNEDWILFDDWKLYYLGDSDESYKHLAEDYLSNSVDYVGFIDETGAYYQKSAYDTYVAAQTALVNAQTPGDIKAAIATYDPASKALKASLDAYAAYYAKYEEAEVFLADRGDTFFGTGAEILSDYLGSEDAPSEQFPNGGALYILNEGLLTPEQILAEVKFLDKLMADAIATGMTDGTDCTELLKNASFAAEDGWTKQPGVTFPTNGNPVGEGPNMLFDISQNLTGLQNGLYEFTVNAAYLAADYSALTGEEDYKAYVYINGYKEKMNSVLSEPSETQTHSSDYYSEGVGYFPNSVDGAYAAFQAGRYKQTVYGLVTDGTMKVGLRNDLRYADGSRAWWTNANLIFRAKNAEILAEVIKNTIPEAEALLANKAGKPEIDALDEAIGWIKYGESVDYYNALVYLKSSMDAVVASTATYVNLSTAIANLKTTIDEYSATASKEAKENAEALYAEASAAYEASTYSNDEATAKIEEINLAAVAMKMPVIDDEQEIVDVSHLIVNNNFDPAKGDKNTGVIEGWTTSAMNGYKQNTVSYNRAAIDLYQDLVGLTPGKYKVTVHTYYRAGYFNEEWDRKEAGEETHLTTLYAATTDEKFETKVKNLYEDAQSTDYGVKVYTLANGLFAPDGTSPTVEFFNQGHYLNELEFVVGEDGKARIGLSKTEILANDYEVVGSWKLYYLGAVEEEKIDTVDMTSVIVNPTFDPAKGDKNTGVIEGWTTSAMNGYKQNTVSYNRAGITLYQDLVGLPKGNYEVTVHTYYRAGYYNEEWDRKEAGEETHLTTLYASTSDKKYETKVMNLYEDAATETYDVNCYTLANGLYAPDGTSSTVAFFNQGHYLNKLQFYVGEDGKARIGLEKTEILANDYEVVGAWNLYYLGDLGEDYIETAIEGVESATEAEVVSTTIYSLNGTVLSAPQKGINILRSVLSDGSVKVQKVLVR